MSTGIITDTRQPKQEWGLLWYLKGRFTAARVLSYFPYAPPVRVLYAFLFLPVFVVGIPVALAMFRFTLVIPNAVFMLAFFGV